MGRSSACAFAALLPLAQIALAQDPRHHPPPDPMLRAVEADARTAAVKQMAIVQLQAKQTRPTGPQTTPEQDRISDLIAADYQFVQAHRAKWRGTKYLVLFDKAVLANMRDPALRNQDPFKVSVSFANRPVNQVKTGNIGFHWYPWFILLSFLALICAVCFAAVRALGAVLGVFSKREPVGQNFDPPGSSFENDSPPFEKWMSFPAPVAPPPMEPARRRCPDGCENGRKSCYACNGSGMRYQGGSEPERCSVCGGLRSIQCMTCSASGWVNW